MTMSNQMALSAASIAVLANNSTLVNMGTMQESFFELDSSTINAGVEATTVQATADKDSIIDGAKTQLTNAVCEISGSVAGIAITTKGLISGNADYNQAKQLLNPDTQEMEVGVSQTTSTPPKQPAQPSSVAPSSESPASSGSARLVAQNEENSPPPANAVAVVKGQNQQTTSQAADQTSATTDELKGDANAKETAESDIAKKAKELQESGKQKMELANTFSNLVSGAIGKSGGIFAYDTTIDQANQTNIKDLQAGLAQALNTQTGLIGSQLSNLNDTRNGTYQLMKTLQEVRG